MNASRLSVRNRYENEVKNVSHFLWLRDITMISWSPTRFMKCRYPPRRMMHDSSSGLMAVLYMFGAVGYGKFPLYELNLPFLYFAYE